jgi:hypothetical protein
MIGNFTEVKPLCYWVQHILPLVYDDSLSYMELLGRVTKRLNELIENNNKMPDYIMELIKEYISSGEIEKVLAEVLANYMLNVKFPPANLTPATGDGSADDTEAIQGCIDYAFNNGGMSVYFPSGSYLTQPLTLRNKATLFGHDRYTTRLVMKGGATTAMLTGDVDELTLSGLGFDGNMDIQVNNVNLFTISVNSAIITNCLLTDGYDLLNITVNDDLQLNDVIFRHAVENALVLKGGGIVQGNNLIFKTVSTLVGKNFVIMDVSKSILEQVKCYGASPNGVLINGNNNVVKIWNEQSLTPFVDNGVNNSVTVYTDSEVEKLTGSKTAIIGGNVTETITGNKGVTAHDITETANGVRTENTTGNRNETTGGNLVENTEGNATETVSGDKVVSSQNYTETVRADKVTNSNKSTETVTTEKDFNANVSRETLGTKTVNVSGVNTENSGSKNETITGDKVVKATNSTEIIDGDKTVTARDISNTAENITNHAKQDLTEQVDGVRNVIVKGANNETVDSNNINVDNDMVTNVKGINNITGKKTTITTNEPLGYYKPTSGVAFDTIPFTDPKDNIYKVLVENKNTPNIYNEIINVKNYGALGDGVNDDYNAIQSCISSNIGKIIFVPSGTYAVSQTIILPKHTVLVGCGQNSILTPIGEIDLIKTIDYDKNMENPPGGFNLFIQLSNITLKGGFYSNVYDYIKSGKTVGSGLKIYGNNFKLYDVTISNFPEYGLMIRNVPNYTVKEEPDLWYETIIENCSINLNGKDGINSDYLFDYNIIACSVHTNGQSDTNYKNKYSNVVFDHGNAKIVNSHFSSLYGPTKPYFSLLCKSNAGMMNISNCHIEGAYLPIEVDSILFNLSNSYIYGSFGECDIFINANNCSLNNVSLGMQVGDPSHEYPEWKGAVKFGNPVNTIYAFCWLVGTKFTSSFEGVTFTTFLIRGYQSKVDEVLCPDPTPFEIEWDSYGFFNGKFNRLRTFDNNNSFFTTGLPNIELPNINYIINNTNVTTPFFVVNGYESGTLNIDINFAKRGQIFVLINRANVEVPWTSTKNTINGKSSGTFAPNVTHIYISYENGNYVGV